MYDLLRMSRLLLVILVARVTNEVLSESVNVASRTQGAKCVSQTSKFSEDFDCNLALDGLVETEWALSTGLGSMAIHFDKEYLVDRIRLMQRGFDTTGLKKIEIQFPDGSKQEVRVQYII